MSGTIKWRLHCTSSPEKLFELLASDSGRERFWAERSTTYGETFLLCFPDGTEELCMVKASIPPSRFSFTYFGSLVEIELQPDGHGGTDLLLINSGVPDEEYQEIHAGWLNVLLPLKAAADFGVDLRNHDPARTWREGYVDQ